MPCDPQGEDLYLPPIKLVHTRPGREQAVKQQEIELKINTAYQ
jgi:hypothetical protein